MSEFLLKFKNKRRRNSNIRRLFSYKPLKSFSSRSFYAGNFRCLRQPRRLFERSFFALLDFSSDKNRRSNRRSKPKNSHLALSSGKNRLCSSNRLYRSTKPLNDFRLFEHSCFSTGKRRFCCSTKPKPFCLDCSFD